MCPVLQRNSFQVSILTDGCESHATLYYPPHATTFVGTQPQLPVIGAWTAPRNLSGLSATDLLRELNAGATYTFPLTPPCATSSPMATPPPPLPSATTCSVPPSPFAVASREDVPSCPYDNKMAASSFLFSAVDHLGSAQSNTTVCYRTATIMPSDSGDTDVHLVR